MFTYDEIKARADKNNEIIVSLEEQPWMEEDEVERDHYVLVTLGDYIPASRDREDEPGHGAYFEDATVYVSVLAVDDMTDENGVRKEILYDLIDANHLGHDDLESMAIRQALEEMG